MNKVDTKMIVRVMKAMSPSLHETRVIGNTLFDKLVFNYHLCLQEKNVVGTLAYFKMIQEYVLEYSNKSTLDVITSRLVEAGSISQKLTKYDLSKPSEFIQAMEDEIVREMVSGAGIGGPLSGLGTNAQVNSTGLAGKDPVLNKKKKNNKIVNVLNKRL